MKEKRNEQVNELIRKNPEMGKKLEEAFRIREDLIRRRQNYADVIRRVAAEICDRANIVAVFPRYARMRGLS